MARHLFIATLRSMFEITLGNVFLFSLFVLAVFYSAPCLSARRFVVPHVPTLLTYVSLFSLFGVIGEEFVNTAYEYFLGSPLWEYRLYPAHDGNITYWFLFIWGALGFYSYFRDTVFLAGKHVSHFLAAVILGVEAIAIELFFNVTYFWVFNDYIFYYFPANLGPLSHFSCLQVIPFYMIVGFVISILIAQHRKLHFSRGSYIVLSFYWFITLTFVYL